MPWEIEGVSKVIPVERAGGFPLDSMGDGMGLEGDSLGKLRESLETN